ncbi:GFA family protein [Celeribacter neptunius]|uniref:Uncharacterized conserved protein n=1 Tax=Celeribacter neptunius TaxID=588602 RepID=A0A1I3LYG0_9RHOB|nr:GFA family protein [Celeribacter neptunius]SFI89752.1 Uncharacterized conserved protein [Celeribacter neptunius]
MTATETGEEREGATGQARIGTCRCGAVRLEVTAPPFMTAACHCDGCKKMSASAFSLTAMFPASGLRVAQGEVIRGGAKGPELDHFMCPDCLSWLFTRVRGFEEMVNVRPTLFDTDDPEVQDWCRPFIETMVAKRLPWVRTPAEHAFDAMPEMADFPALLEAFAARG